MRYRASTEGLYRALGKPLPPFRANEAWAETYAVYSASLWGTPERAEGGWAPSPALLDAAQAALADNAGTYAAQGLAVSLAAWGARDAAVAAALHPWHGVFLRWAADGYSAAQVGHVLQAAGAADPLTDEAARRIDAWIADPWASMFEHGRLRRCLFGERLASASLVDDGFCPAHDVLLATLATHAVPPLAIAAVSQRRGEGEVFRDVTAEVGPLFLRDANGELVEVRLSGERADGVGVYSDRESHWVVTYEHAGATHELICESLGTRLDLATLVAHFDLLMTRAGRREAAFQLDRGLGENADWGIFLVADRDRFPEAVRCLHLPLEQ